MKYLLFAIFYTINIKVAACDTLNTICNTVCIHDGSDRGVVINKQCFCADRRDLTEVFAKMPISGKIVVDKEPKKSFWE
jgi:hypothetical protein